MKKYRLTASGMDFGTYSAESREEAIRACIIDAGYTSDKDIAEQIAVGGIEAEEIDHL